MILKVGLAMMLLSLVFAGGVVAFVGLRGEPRTDQTLPVEPQAIETKVEERKSDPVKKKRETDEPDKEELRPEPRPEPQAEPRPGPRRPEAVPTAADWQQPTQGELASAKGPRYFAPEPDEGMTLTV